VVHLVEIKNPKFNFGKMFKTDVTGVPERIVEFLE
jgi:hypothetical protein